MKRTRLWMLIIFLASSSILPAMPATGADSALGQQVRPDLIYRPASLTAPGIPPFTPNDLRKAYSFVKLYAEGVNGVGESIAVVDAFGNPSLSSDLATFNSLTGLPSATVNIYYPDGVPRHGDTGWAVETSLDVEWAHAMAPGASIDLVVALNANLGSIFDGIAFVANSLTGESVLSMSFGQSESLYPTTGSFTVAGFHQLFMTVASHGTTLVASSGDSGSSSCCNIQYPSSDPLVLAVGGTSLSLASDASYSGESVWSGSTSGSSIIFSKPSFQQGLGDSARDDVDVSYDADPNTGVLVIFSGTLYQVGGTSAGAPQWSALVALGDQLGSARLGIVASQLYRLSLFHDVTRGSNGFFSAGPGWDYPTGLGSPNATAVVDALGGATVSINSSLTFQGAQVMTNGTLTLNLATLAVSGNVTLVARNSTTLEVLFTKTYMVPVLPLVIKGGVLQVSFLLNVPVFPYALSFDVTIRLQNSPSANFLLTRQIDIDGNGVVDFLDASTLAIAYGSGIGSVRYNPHADIDGNGTVGFLDASTLGYYFQAMDLR